MTATALPQKTQHRITRVEHNDDLLTAMGYLERAPNLGFDFETALITPQDQWPAPRLLALSAPDETLLIDLWKVNPEPIWPILWEKRLLGHYLEFDLGVAYKHYGFLPGRVQDSIAMQQVLNSGRFCQNHAKGHQCSLDLGLDDVVLTHLGHTLKKDPAIRLTFATTPELTEEHWRYAAQDAMILHWLHVKQAEKLRRDNLWATAVIENKMIPGLVVMAQAGVPFNEERWLALEAQAKEKRLGIEKALTGMLPRKYVDGKGKRIGPEQQGMFEPGGEDAGTVFATDWDGTRGKRPSWMWDLDGKTELMQLFAELGVSLADTEDVTLAFCEHPFAGELRHWREHRKRETTYGHTYWKGKKGVSRLIDGRIRADWRQFVSTGRMACGDPNLQNIPRDPRYRCCFEAPAGYRYVKVDLSQIELRVCAYITGDKKMRAAYQKGLDIHSLTAQLISGKTQADCEPSEWKMLRQAAKPVNFGLIYMMSAEGLQRNTLAEYGIALHLNTCEDYKSRYFDKDDGYFGVKRWHINLCRSGSRQTRTPNGRRRWIDENTEYDRMRANTRRANTPIQGGAADILKAAFGEAYLRREEIPYAPIMMVHDEIVALAPTDRAEEVGAWMRGLLIEAGTPMIAPVPVDAEVQIGETWAGQEWENDPKNAGWRDNWQN